MTPPTEFVPSFPLYFDSSMLSSLKTCERLFYNSYIQHYKPREPSVHLLAGGAFAHGMQVARTSRYVEGKDEETSIAEGLNALMLFYGDYQCPADSAKSLQRMMGAFEFYFAHYPLSEEESPIILPGGRHAIEFSFNEPTPVLHPETGDPIVIVGRMDAILNFAGGKFITDEKTTSSMGPSWSRQWDLRAQFSGYSWACRRSGIAVDGALIRGVSILKTKYETQQVPSYRPQWQVDRWEDEAFTWIEGAVKCWKSGKWRHNLDHACGDFGGCQFRNACLSQDPQPWLDTGFERRVWNPLLHEEKKL